jgi:uncharacterized protein (UPF0332 family)
MLTLEEKKAIINYRRQKAYDSLKEVDALVKLAFWNLAGNRLYYAVYHMASALLLDKGFSAHTHSGVIHLIGQNFIAKGFLDKSYGRLFTRLFDLRQSGDYDDLYDATEEEIVPLIEKTESFIRAMDNLLTLVR